MEHAVLLYEHHHFKNMTLLVVSDNSFRQKYGIIFQLESQEEKVKKWNILS